MRIVLAQAREVGADTLITTGGIQSNHCRVTAAAAARHGLKCVIVANGAPPAKPTANAPLDALFGAELRYVARREDRTPMVEAIAEGLRREGSRPFVIPLGASTPHGAAAFALAVGELAQQLKNDSTIPTPDVIVHSTSSGGTQAGLITGCRIYGLPTRILGFSADESSAALGGDVRRILTGLEGLLGAQAGALASDETPHIDLLHTNHCLEEETRPHEAERAPELLASSQARLARARELLADGPIDAERLMAMTRDPDAICQRARAPYQVESSGAMVMRPAAGELWAVWGLPSENEYERFALGAR